MQTLTQVAQVVKQDEKWGAGKLCPVCLQVKDSFGRCDCNAKDVNLNSQIAWVVGDDLDQAAKLGREDALNSSGFCAEDFYVPGSMCWESYAAGFQAGLAVLKIVADPSPELEFLDRMLNELRVGALPPVVRLTAEQMEEIGNERIGAEICLAPYLW